MDNTEQAGDYYEAALPLCKTIGYQQGEANVLRSMGDLERRLDNFEQAGIYYRDALNFYRTINYQQGEAYLIESLGDLELQQNDFDQACIHYDTALSLYSSLHDRRGESRLSIVLAAVSLVQEQWAQARNYCEQALPLVIAESNPQRLAITLFYLSRARFELGDHEQGMQDAQKALALFRDIQDEQWEALTKQYLAEMQARSEH